jgi:hypothetical protein
MNPLNRISSQKPGSTDISSRFIHKEVSMVKCLASCSR